MCNQVRKSWFLALDSGLVTRATALQPAGIEDEVNCNGKKVRAYLRNTCGTYKGKLDAGLCSDFSYDSRSK